MPKTLQSPGHAALRQVRVSIANQSYHVTSSTVERARHFADFASARAACAAFTSPRTLGASQLLAWVLMPDHAHWLIALAENETLAHLVNRMKSHSARAANLARGQSSTIWSRGYYDHALRQEEDLATVGRYIVANPLRAGLVESLGAYPYWDAVWLR